MIDAGPQRLQKILAAGGFGSRRHCEQLIADGRVEVDGQVVAELGTRVDPAAQEVKVDGERLKLGRRTYYAVYKPVGYVTTNQDPTGRPRVVDLVPSSKEHLFPVGRLDLSSEGLMIVTNDGELAMRLAHPRFGVEKTYQALVAGHPTPEMLEKLRAGIRLAEGPARVVDVQVQGVHKQSTQLEIVLAEGKNREIRRILAKIGHKVMRLRRVAIGKLKLKDMQPGECRRLLPDEVELLLHSPPRMQQSRRPRHGAAPAGKSLPPGKKIIVDKTIVADSPPASGRREPPGRRHPSLPFPAPVDIPAAVDISDDDDLQLSQAHPRPGGQRPTGSVPRLGRKPRPGQGSRSDSAPRSDKAPRPGKKPPARSRRRGGPPPRKRD